MRDPGIRVDANLRRDFRRLRYRHQEEGRRRRGLHPYSYDGLKMEIIAVKASDGTIRTALNTCQACYQSGRGYNKQVGDVFVRQNCGNRFRVDQVEKIKGGCNPVPILEGDKTDLGAAIGG